MDIEKAQIVIDETIGRDYIIYQVEDRDKYAFAYYKHRDYDVDDQRGILIGVGPVVLIKETGEYKLLGSGEMVLGDYFAHKECEEPVLLDFDEIIEKITRHQNVNDEDIFDLQRYWESKFGESNVSLRYSREFDYRNHLMLETTSIDFINFIKQTWATLRLPYEIINPNEILLSRFGSTVA